MSKYIVVDTSDLETFRSLNAAIECAKNDVGMDGWEPCQSLAVCEIVARVYEKHIDPEVIYVQKRRRTERQ